MIGAGCLIVAAGLSPLQSSWRAAAMIVLLGGAVVVPVFYSWWLWRHRSKA
jgi:hypothetical protein